STGTSAASSSPARATSRSRPARSSRTDDRGPRETTMPRAKRYWDDVKEGQALPEVRVDKLTRTDFVKYAGASGDFNPIHHDQVFAEASGNPTVFAMGMLNASILSRVVTGFAGRPGVRSYKVR